MARLSASQLRHLNRILLALHEDVDDVQPMEPIIELLERLLPCSWVSVDEVSLATGEAFHRSGRRLEKIPQLEEKLRLLCRQNPVVDYALKGHFRPVLKVSDFITLREFRQTGYFEGMLRYIPSWRDQAAVAIRLPGSSLGFALSRDKAFSGEELLMLELLQPHIERILRRSAQYLLLTTLKPLTPRERDVLHWMAQGKRDAEIALILGICVRTVEHHVRISMRKLGVETRTAAAAEVWRSRRLRGIEPQK